MPVSSVGNRVASSIAEVRRILGDVAVIENNPQIVFALAAAIGNRDAEGIARPQNIGSENIFFPVADIARLRIKLGDDVTAVVLQHELEILGVARGHGKAGRGGNDCQLQRFHSRNFLGRREPMFTCPLPYVISQNPTSSAS